MFKIPDKRQLQQTGFDHSADFEFKKIKGFRKYLEQHV